MSNTTNLNLEELTINDNLRTTFVQKLNNNQTKIDTAYGTLKNGLLTQTGKSTLTEAIAEVQNMADDIEDLTEQVETLESVGTATASDIVSGKTALVQGETITGTAFATTTTAIASDVISGKTAYANDGTLITGTKVDETPLPTINVTTSGSYASYILNYGAGINADGRLVIYAYSYSTGYEHYYWVNTSIGVGTIEYGWNISSWDTGDPVHMECCTITGIDPTEYSQIDINLEGSTINSSYDYVRVNVTLTATAR